MLLTELAKGAIQFLGRATIQAAGGMPVESKSFFVDNATNPGDYTIAPFASWDAVITAMDGGVADTLYAGTVTMSVLHFPPGSGAVGIFVNTVPQTTVNTWVNGSTTDLIEWVFQDSGLYTMQVTDGVTTSTVVITVL